MKYILKHVEIERYPVNNTNLDNGTADRIKEIHADKIGEIQSDFPLTTGDIIVHDGCEWNVLRRIYVRVNKEEYVVLYVSPNNTHHLRSYMNHQWTDIIPLFIGQDSEVYQP